MKTYYSDVTVASKLLWDSGVKILQGNRLGITDKQHVDALEKYIKLSGNDKHVADMGCGFGEVSKILSRKRNGRKATFWLVNNNHFQMKKCRDWDGRCEYIERDMCATGIGNDEMDLVMFNWSMCHVDALDALSEVWRITKEDGRLFIYDYERVSGDNAFTWDMLHAKFISDDQFRKDCQLMGWRDVETIHPGGNDTLFRQSCGNDALYEVLISGLIPVIWKAQK